MRLNEKEILENKSKIYKDLADKIAEDQLSIKILPIIAMQGFTAYYR